MGMNWTVNNNGDKWKARKDGNKDGTGDSVNNLTLAVSKARSSTLHCTAL